MINEMKVKECSLVSWTKTNTACIVKSAKLNLIKSKVGTMSMRKINAKKIQLLICK